MIGPFSFSINDEMGLLIDGFDTPPNMMMGHGKNYYASSLEKLGFTKTKDVIAYHYDLNPNSVPILERVQKRALASGDVSLRPMNMPYCHAPA